MKFIKCITLGIMVFASGQTAFAASTPTLLPSSDGVNKQWGRVPVNVLHYTAVDETNCNGTTDYVNEVTVGERESFGIDITSVPNGAVVTSIQITPCASKNSSGRGSDIMNVYYRWDNNASVDSGSYSLSGTTPTNLATTTFTGLAFTKSSTSTLEIGAVYSSGSKGVRLSRIAAIVSYQTIPTDPTNLIASSTPVSATSSTIALTWTDNSSNEDGFRIEQSTDGVNYSLVANKLANSTSHTQFNVLRGQTYYYRVEAYNAVGDSAYSTYTLIN